MVPSNFRLIVESSGRPHFEAAMKMCFDDFDKASAYQVDVEGLHLFWHTADVMKNESSPLPLPHAMDCKAATEFAWNWLKKADRGREPDIDGSVYPNGYIVKHVSHGWGYKFVTIQAVWTEYHK
jgi:hypothetical protein